MLLQEDYVTYINFDQVCFLHMCSTLDAKHMVLLFKFVFP